MFNIGLIPLPVKIAAIAVAIIGAALWGYMKGSSHAEVEIANFRADAEKQISDLKTENAKIADNVVVKYVDRVKTIHDNQIVYRDGLAGLGEGTNNLSNGWITLHDSAAKMSVPDSQMAADKSPSGVMDNTALAVVLSNYAKCHATKQQLISIQQWITANREAINRNVEGAAP